MSNENNTQQDPHGFEWKRIAIALGVAAVLIVLGVAFGGFG